MSAKRNNISEVGLRSKSGKLDKNKIGVFYLIVF